MDDGQETKHDSKWAPLAQLDQLHEDFALAIALQEQERTLMESMMSESDSDDGHSDEDDIVDRNYSRNYHGFFMDDDLMLDTMDFLQEEEDNNYQDMEEDNIDPDELSYEELLTLGETVGVENRGLSADVIAKFLRPYAFKCEFESKQELDRCVICQVEYGDGESLVMLPCKHSYHKECISEWLQIKKVCPICNTEVSSSKLAKNG